MKDELLYYDFSKLKADGSHYVVVSLTIPYAIHLPNDNYEIEIVHSSQTSFRKHIVQVIIESRWRELDPRRTVVLGKRYEKHADRQGAYRYTYAWVYIPVGSSKPNIHHSYEITWERIRPQAQFFSQIALTAINKLLEVYRYCSKECHIVPLVGHKALADFDVAFLFNELPADWAESRFRTVTFPMFSLQHLTSAVDPVPDEVINTIRNLLLSQSNVPAHDKLLLNAYDLLDQTNYRLAVIEAETAFETAIQHFVFESYNGRKEETARLRKINQFTNLLRNALFQSLVVSRNKTFEKGTNPFDEWHKKVWDIRNHLVHGIQPTISYSKALTAITTVEKTLKYLLDRPQTNPWRYS